MVAAPVKELVVVSNGFIVATHPFGTDVYDKYPHDGTVAWFEYGEVLVLHEEVTIADTSYLVGDGIDPVTMPTNVPTTSRLVSMADPRLTMTLAEAKAAVISMLRDISNHQITAQYPLQTQILLERLAPPYTTANRDDARTFIDGILGTLNTKIGAVNALGTVPAVIAYDVWA